MSMYLLWEWTNPKEEERNKRRYKHLRENLWPYIERKLKEGVKWEILDLTDCTGRMFALHTFDTIEDFDKVWNDDEYKKLMSQYSYFVDDCSLRILRGTKKLEPK